MIEKRVKATPMNNLVFNTEGQEIQFTDLKMTENQFVPVSNQYIQAWHNQSQQNMVI